MSDINNTDTEGTLPSTAESLNFDEDALSSSCEELFKTNPELKSLVDQLAPLYTEEYGIDDFDDEGETEVTCYEFNGKDYMLARTISIGDNIYYYFININNVMDFFFQKRLVEDGEEYFIDLDDEKEFELIQTFFHRELLLKIREKLQQDNASQSIPVEPDSE